MRQQLTAAAKLGRFPAEDLREVSFESWETVADCVRKSP